MIVCGGPAPWTTTGVAQVQLTVDASQKGAAWSRYYETGVAADHANTLLSTAWGRNIQNALKKGHDQTGFQYARFHGILNSDIGVYTEKGSGTPVYVWTRFDQVYDAVVAAGQGGYPQLYNNTVTGLLAGDPQLKVGGPAASAASSLEQIPSLVSYTKSNNLKLDFLSWHRYANDDTASNRADANAMLTYFDRVSGVIAASGFKGLSINDE
jgi:hypothetical protein